MDKRYAFRFASILILVKVLRLAPIDRQKMAHLGDEDGLVDWIRPRSDFLVKKAQQSLRQPAQMSRQRASDKSHVAALGLIFPFHQN